MNLYATKGAVNARLIPLVDRLARAGVTPDQVTLAAVSVAILAGACLPASPSVPVLLLAVPVLAGVRILLNLVDGNMACRTGKIHARGELYNEVGDRMADIAFLAPAAWLPAALPHVVLLGVMTGVKASYVGITAEAAGGERIYRGILSKPGRMALLCVTCVVAFVLGPADTRPWLAFGPLLLLGTTLTLIERIVVAIRRLP